jgi:anti-anti-sigma regulatory factor
MNDCTIDRQREAGRVTYRLSGVFDRAGAWALRAKLDRESADEVLLDFSLVRDFSDLGVAVVAHGLAETPRRVLFRGLRQHQLRIFRYCGIAIEETSARESLAAAPVPPSAEPRA